MEIVVHLRSRQKNVNDPALPSTGESDCANLSIFGGGTLLSILGALFLRRKNKKG